MKSYNKYRFFSILRPGVTDGAKCYLVEFRFPEGIGQGRLHGDKVLAVGLLQPPSQRLQHFLYL